MKLTRVRTFAPGVAAALVLTLAAGVKLPAQSLASVARPQAAAQARPDVEAKPAAAAKPARGFIWKVERDGRQAWLVGSLHLLTPDFYPLPDSMEQAFTSSDVLMEEIDMNDATDPQFAALILSKAMNPAGTTLSSQLTPPTLAAVSKWLSKMGLGIEALQPMKPWMVAMTVQTLALTLAKFDPALGIDKHFGDAATKAGKKLIPLETAMEQINFLDGLSAKTQDEMLRQSVEAADEEQSEIKAIAAAWRAGDAAAMERFALADMKDSPEVYETLLVSRNRRWVPKIESCMQTNRSCFVVVGAAHLVGPQGLVALLKQGGYSVTQR